MPIDVVVAICDIKGMENLTDFVEAEKPKSMAKIAKEIGVSRPFLYQLLSGDRLPSLKVAIAIQRNTAGSVPISSWPNLQKVHEALIGSHADSVIASDIEGQENPTERAAS